MYVHYTSVLVSEMKRVDPTKNLDDVDRAVVCKSMGKISIWNIPISMCGRCNSQYNYNNDEIPLYIHIKDTRS